METLSGLRVLDMATGLAGSSAALALSEAGADVIKLWVDDGHDADAAPPAWRRVLDRGKARLMLDATQAPDRATLATLLARADVLIHDFTPQQAEARGLDETTLLAHHPRLVISAIGSWPAGHAWCETPHDELLVLARLGILDEQPGHRPGPVFIRLPYASWVAGWLSAIAVMARLLARRRDGRGGVAHTSLAQAALVPMTMHWARATTPTPAFAKGLDKALPIPLHQCSDGRWVHVHYSPDNAPWMAEGLARLGEAGRAQANAQWPPSHVAPNFGANRLIMAERPAADWVQHFWAHDVSAQIAAPFGEIYADAQARLNGYAVAVDDPALGPTWQPGPAYHLDPPPRVHGPQEAPVLNAAQSLARWGASAPEPSTASTPSNETPAAPLAGLKVVDLGAYLAGPYACMLLADLGAQVIKVEPPDGDAMRRLERAFAGAQRGKQGLALKLGDPAVQPVVNALVDWADVVHHNIRLPAARKLGVDPQTLRARKPGLITGHISSYGPQGPRADWPGFDQLMQAACGWEVESGGAGNPPQWLRFGIGDHFAALSCTFAMLLALHARDAAGQSGQGQHVASSLLGGMLLTMSEAVMLPDGQLTDIAHLDAEQTGLSRYQRLHRCSDGWIAVSARTAPARAAFDAWAGVDADIDAVARCAALPAADALATLQQAGVPSAPVLQDQSQAFFEQPAHAALHAHTTHQVYGTLAQIGAFWHFGDLPLALHLPPPALGEHSASVLAMLGIPPELQADLAERRLLRTAG